MTHATLILARHGETAFNREGRYQGGRDTPLNETGVAQASKLAAWLLGVPIDAVYSSPLARALQTAQAVADLHAHRVETLPGLVEINHGQWEGLLVTEVAERWPDMARDWWLSPQKVRMPGGEMLEEVQARANGAVGQILHAHHNQTVFACAHDAVNRALLCSWLGMPLSAFWRFRQDASAVNIVQFTRSDGGIWMPRVSLMNSVMHTGHPLAERDHAAK